MVKASSPVIVNLQASERDLARRMIDFCSGLTYAVGGSMEKVAESVFLLTPSNVEVSPKSASAFRRTDCSGPEPNGTHPRPWARSTGALSLDLRRRYPQPPPVRDPGTRGSLLCPAFAGIGTGADHPVLRSDHRAGPAAGAPCRAADAGGRHHGGSLTDHRVDSHPDRQSAAIARKTSSIHHLAGGGRYHPSMDLSAKVLREVEFQSRLRGYDTDEVDEFLEKIAVAVDEMQEKMRQLAYRAERAERSISERAADENDDSIRRTLVLAQRTADLAVREAEEQAAEIMDTARSESGKLLTDARENAQRLTSEAERSHKDDIARLEGQRDQVGDELRKLSNLLDTERERLAGSLRAALSVVEQTLSPPMEISELGLAPASSQAGVRTTSRLRSTRTPRQRHRRSRLPTQVRTTTTAPRRTKAGGRTSLQFRRSKTQGRTRRRAKPSTWWSRAGAMTTLAERQLTTGSHYLGDWIRLDRLSSRSAVPVARWSLRGPRVSNRAGPRGRLAQSCSAEMLDADDDDVAIRQLARRP